MTRKRFDTIVRTTKRHIALLASGEGALNGDYRTLEQTIARALGKLDDGANTLDDREAAWAQVSALRGEYRTACDAGYAARQSIRAKEIAELRQKERDARLGAPR